jgi:membrane associated rhomboid family serine protease/Zn-finger nucleic acid-binding protein
MELILAFMLIAKIIYRQSGTISLEYTLSGDDMLICPKCNKPLKKTANRAGIFWLCPSCNGRAVTVEGLRRILPRQIVNSIWQKARIGVGAKAKRCAACQRLMVQVPVVVAEETEFIDICTGCHFVWFDPAEFERFPKLQIPKPTCESLSNEARYELAMANLETLKQKQIAQQDGISCPDHWWELVLGLFGLPVEYNTTPLRHKPWATWSLAVIIAVVSIVAMFNLEEVITRFGLVPSEFTRYFGFTFISSFFLHAGFFHLIGNLYFLILFGDNSEDILGRTKYLLLIALSALAGSAAHILFDPRSTVPCIGASGGISGILAYYCIRFPKARIGILFFFRWIRLPAPLMFALWILMQMLYAYMQKMGFSSISAFAHLGGASIGIIFWLITRKSGFSMTESSKLTLGY